ncbi:MAG: twin-arginine translocase TatA/TatE family subunit [Bacteroidetes bacterium]|nr:twin-arginine translocase TatA/TatE family subunit [Bacteroidota bacterium]
MILLFLDIGAGEIMLILAVVFLLYGPKKVPEIARQIGKTMNDLKRATSDLTKEFQEGANEVKKEVSQVRDHVLSEPLKLKDNLISDLTSYSGNQPVSTTDQPPLTDTIEATTSESDKNQKLYRPPGTVPRN